MTLTKQYALVYTLGTTFLYKVHEPDNPEGIVEILTFGTHWFVSKLKTRDVPTKDMFEATDEEAKAALNLLGS